MERGSLYVSVSVELVPGEPQLPVPLSMCELHPPGGEERGGEQSSCFVFLFCLLTSVLCFSFPLFAVLTFIPPTHTHFLLCHSFLAFSLAINLTLALSVVKM